MLQLSSIQSRSNKLQFLFSERWSNSLEGEVAKGGKAHFKLTYKLEISFYPMCDCFSGFSFETAVTAAFSLLLKSINSSICILYSHDSHDLTFFFLLWRKSPLLFCLCVHMCTCMCVSICIGRKSTSGEVPQESAHLFSSCCPGAHWARLAVQSPRDPALSATTALGPQAQVAMTCCFVSHIKSFYQRSSFLGPTWSTRFFFPKPWIRFTFSRAYTRQLSYGTGVPKKIKRPFWKQENGFLFL